ncbi:MAG: hypothetical protein B7Y41_02000 [Hydrogenophilales bacterium 28-61-23]|nr:MAG: hypothetical protein B7Y41_02000 [Hydrogenophilales bacterium 28-61-23]
MSVINQVLKDLDRQGANVSAPAGVIAVNQPEAAAPRWRWLLVGMIGVALAAFWWFSPAAKHPVAHPEQAAARQLGAVDRNLRNGAAESVSAEAQRFSSSAAPSAILPAPPADNASGSSALQTPAAVTRPEAKPAALPAASSAVAAASMPAPPAVAHAATPRLDTRLPEPRPNPAVVKAWASDASNAKTPQLQAEEAWRQANRMIEQGRNRDAREQLENLLRLEPSHVAGRQRLIGLLLQTGGESNNAPENSARAEALLREGMALNPNEAWYARSLAQLHLQRGDAAQAAATLKSALAKHPDAANWALYASTAAKLGKPADAALAYREALQSNPEQGNWWIGLAVALEKTGDQNEAGAAYQRALQTRLSAELRDYAQQKTRELGAR